MTSWLVEWRLRRAAAPHLGPARRDLAQQVATWAEALDSVLSPLLASDRAHVLAAMHEPADELEPDTYMATFTDELDTALGRLPESDRAQVLAAMHQPARELKPDILIMVPRCLVHVARPGGFDCYAITWSARADFPTASEATGAMHEQLDVDAFCRAVLKLRRRSQKAQRADQTRMRRTSHRTHRYRQEFRHRLHSFRWPRA